MKEPHSNASRGTESERNPQSAIQSTVVPRQTPVPNMDPTLQAFLNTHPHLTSKATRENLFRLQSISEQGLDYNRIDSKARCLPILTSGDGDGGPTDQLDTLLHLETKAYLFKRLYNECKRNQFVFHTNDFVVDTILDVFAEYRLTYSNLYQLRMQCLAWHRDVQCKFLFKHLLGWCRSFFTGKPEYGRVAFEANEGVAEAWRKLKQAISEAFNEATFGQVWRNVAPLVDFGATFGQPGTAGRDAPALYFVKVVLVTMAPLALQLVAAERGEAYAGALDKQQHRKEMINTYKQLRYYSNFAGIDKASFAWSKGLGCTTGSEKPGAAANIWFDDESPPHEESPPHVSEVGQGKEPHERPRVSSPLKQPGRHGGVGGAIAKSRPKAGNTRLAVARYPSHNAKASRRMTWLEAEAYGDSDDSYNEREPSLPPLLGN